MNLRPLEWQGIECTYIFTTGSLLIHSIHYTISAWAAGEPSTSTQGVVGEDCVVIDKTHNYLWNDIACQMSLYPVCEKTVSEKVFHF